MRSLFAIVVAILITTKVQAQENVRLTQYFQNPQYLNPAFSGIESFVDLKLGHKQNVSAYEMAPQTSFLSISAPFNASSRRATELYSLRTSNPAVYSKLSKGTITPIKHGIGGVLISEKQGAFNQQHLLGSYALHLAINKKYNLSAGVSGYYLRNRVDVDQITLEQDDEIEDPVKDYYRLNNLIYKTFGVNTGILFYTQDYYFGYTIKNVYQKDFSISNSIINDNALPENGIAHSVQMGYRFNFKNDLTFLPGFFLNYYADRPIIYTANAKVLYDKRYWGGLAYSSSGSMSLMAGMKIKEIMNLSYSYDYTVSGISNYISGSHEIILGIMLMRNGSKKINMW